MEERMENANKAWWSDAKIYRSRDVPWEWWNMSTVYFALGAKMGLGVKPHWTGLRDGKQRL